MRAITARFLSFQILFCALSVLCFAPSGQAAEEVADAPSSQIKHVFDRVGEVVKASAGKPDDGSVDKQLQDIIRPVFNFEEMSRRSLGADWNKATPAEREEFVKLFSDLLSRTYLKRIRRNAEEATIQKITDQLDGDKAMVRSTVNAKGELISLDYRMAKYDGKWRIYDVIVENVGLVSNYRSEFPGIIQSEGFSGLLTRLRNKQIEAPKEAKKVED